jgi:hypothetical protein
MLDVCHSDYFIFLQRNNSISIEGGVKVFLLDFLRLRLENPEKALYTLFL